MEWLKKLLEGAKITDGVLDTEALSSAISAELPKHMIPKATFNDINDQLKTANDTIKDLKKSNKDNEELQNKIATHEDTIKKLQEDSEAKIKGLKVDNALIALLTKNKAKHVDLLVSKFDKSKITLKDDGSIEGVDEQFKGIKESYKDLFGSKLDGDPPPNPDPGSADPKDLNSALAQHYTKN